MECAQLAAAVEQPTDPESAGEPDAFHTLHAAGSTPHFMVCFIGELP
jgi:hypothetical protein